MHLPLRRPGFHRWFSGFGFRLRGGPPGALIQCTCARPAVRPSSERPRGRHRRAHCGGVRVCRAEFPRHLPPVFQPQSASLPGEPQAGAFHPGLRVRPLADHAAHRPDEFSAGVAMRVPGNHETPEIADVHFRIRHRPDGRRKPRTAPGGPRGRGEAGVASSPAGPHPAGRPRGKYPIVGRACQRIRSDRIGPTRSVSVACRGQHDRLLGSRRH